MNQPHKRFAGAAVILGGALLMMVSGCARPYGVPVTSQLVAESPKGQAASFQAPDEGTVYVDGPGRPGQPRNIVYSGLVTRGQTVCIDPESGHLMVDNKPVIASLNLSDKSFYQIWFQPTRHDLLAP